MNFPQGIDKFTISRNRFGVFPPIGFLSMEETADGGGDYLGLYWEIGMENNAPVVCTARHEEGLLVPEFKDFDTFSVWFDETGGYEAATMNLNDIDFFVSLTYKGKVLTKNGKTEEAIQKLERSISRFSEYPETWYWLADNYHKMGLKDKADKAILNGITSNFFFGFPSKGMVDMFNEMKPSRDIQNNPLVERGTDWIRGGDHATPLAVDYDVLNEIINTLKVEKYYREAMLMRQNYGVLMSFEKEDVVRRYGFNEASWLENFSDELFSIYPDRRYSL